MVDFEGLVRDFLNREKLPSLSEELDRVTAALMTAALKKSRTVAGASRLLKISRPTFYQYACKLKIDIKKEKRKKK